MAGRPDSPNAVQFDVGGKLFKTSRSLIDQHKGTMLARLVSDTWQEDPTKPVFIDRNGSIFEQVLDYLRYGSIVLPSKIPMSMFLRDLDFYGIVPAEGTVKTESEGWLRQVASRNNKIETMEAEGEQLKLENDIDFLASYCATQYALTAGNHSTTLSFISEADRNKESGKLWHASSQVYNNGTPRDLFEQSLSKFGLHLRKIKRSYTGCAYMNIDMELEFVADIIFDFVTTIMPRPLVERRSSKPF